MSVKVITFKTKTSSIHEEAEMTNPPVSRFKKKIMKWLIYFFRNSIKTRQETSKDVYALYVQ